MKYQNSEVSRFIVIGMLTVLIDLVAYILFIVFGFGTVFAKGLSFSSGTIFAYFANKNYTFESHGKGSMSFILFISLYFFTLVINILTNELILDLTSSFYYSILIAFLFATFISASLNFIGMKFIVFKKENRAQL